MQCIKQGYWYEDDPIGLLPGIDIKRRTDIIFGEGGHPTESTKGNDKLITLEKLGHYGVKKLQPIMDRFSIPAEDRGKFIHICQRIPVLDEIHFEEQKGADRLTLYSKHVYAKSNKNFEIYCDKFPKTQKEVWFCIAYQGEELLMVKRCQPRQVGKTVVVGCDLIIPEEIQGEKMDFMLINDAMDLKYQLSHQLI